MSIIVIGCGIAFSFFNSQRGVSNSTGTIMIRPGTTWSSLSGDDRFTRSLDEYVLVPSAKLAAVMGLETVSSDQRENIISPSAPRTPGTALGADGKPRVLVSSWVIREFSQKKLLAHYLLTLSKCGL